MNISKRDLKKLDKEKYDYHLKVINYIFSLSPFPSVIDDKQVIAIDVISDPDMPKHLILNLELLYTDVLLQDLEDGKMSCNFNEPTKWKRITINLINTDNKLLTSGK